MKGTKDERINNTGQLNGKKNERKMKEELKKKGRRIKEEWKKNESRMKEAGKKNK